MDDKIKVGLAGVVAGATMLAGVSAVIPDDPAMGTEAVLMENQVIVDFTVEELEIIKAGTPGMTDEKAVEMMDKKINAFTERTMISIEYRNETRDLRQTVRDRVRDRRNN